MIGSTSTVTVPPDRNPMTKTAPLVAAAFTERGECFGAARLQHQVAPRPPSAPAPAQERGSLR